jgi:protein-tyrosine kinase
MSRLKKRLNQIEALRRQGQQNVPELVELSEREQLELDISRLLGNEHPESLESKKKQIKLSYSNTKTIAADPEALRCNHVFAHIPNMQITEQIEMLRTQVLKKLESMSGNTLMITSANHREGKTFISTNLAVSIVQNLDRTVMLIDADLKNRSYPHHDMTRVFFNSETRPGLSDYLLREANITDLLVNPGIPRLTLLPGGKSLPDASVYLGSQRMEDLINETKKRYSTERILIFDSSSCLSNSGPMILSKHVDAVLLVVENERTEKKDLLRTIESLETKKIIGVVMNKAKCAVRHY